MEGRVINGDWKPTSPSKGERTMVLLGRTSNGKSATGNSILGRRAFKASAGSFAVTKTCEMKTTVLKDGQVINVIDTPGLFDSSDGSEFVGKEIVKCIGMAKDGIHAVLVVFSVRSRFSQEEEAVVQRLQTLFGKKIFDYMIVVFTGGDVLEDNEKTLEDYLGYECPKNLKEILKLCENRCVLFDNKTKDEAKRTEQVQQLLSLVNSVIMQNGGQPYTNGFLAELKRGVTELRDQQAEVDSLKEHSKREISRLMGQMQESYEDRSRRITEMSKLKETTTSLEQQLAEEHATRLKVESKLKETITRLEQQLAEEHTARLKVESKLKETTTRLEQQLADEQDARLKVESKLKETTTRLEQQLAEEHAARLKVESKLKETTARLKQQLADEQDARLKVESKLKETIIRLEQQLAEKHAAQLKVEEVAQLAQMKSNDEIRKLRESLEKAQSARLKAEEVAQLAQIKSNDEIRKLRENLEKAQSARLKAEEVAQLDQMKSNEEIRQLRKNLEKAQSDQLKAEEATQLAEKKSNDEIYKLRENLEKAQRDINEGKKGDCAIM